MRRHPFGWTAAKSMTCARGWQPRPPAGPSACSLSKLSLDVMRSPMIPKRSAEHLVATLRVYRHGESRQRACPSAGPRRAFTVALSREAGVDAGPVADEIGERLGWPVFDDELVDLIAQEMEAPTEAIRRVDE